MTRIESLPKNAHFEGNKYFFEIENDLNHIPFESEYFVVYEGHRYVCGYIDDNKSEKDEIKQLFLKSLQLLVFLSGFCVSFTKSYEVSLVPSIALNTISAVCLVGVAARMRNILPLLTSE
jgi:hypothetical protein